MTDINSLKAEHGKSLILDVNNPKVKELINKIADLSGTGMFGLVMIMGDGNIDKININCIQCYKDIALCYRDVWQAMYELLELK